MLNDFALIQIKTPKPDRGMMDRIVAIKEARP
jgi:hypothetical protein